MSKLVLSPEYHQQEAFDDSYISDLDVLRLTTQEINEGAGSLDDVVTAEGGTLYIGIDSEWQRIPNRDANHILCYTAAVYTKDKDGEPRERLYIIHTDGPRRSQRLSLNKLLGHVIHQAKEDKMISVWPKKIVVFCHFMRADIVNFSDFWNTDNKHSVEGLRNTVASLGLPKSIVKEANIGQDTDIMFIGSNQRVKRSALLLKDKNRKPRLTQVKFVDTLLLSPLASGSLENIAKLIGFDKLELPDGQSIENMQKLKNDEPEIFEAYALRDAQIALRFGLHMMKTIKQEFDQDNLPSTLGSLGVKLVKKSFDDEKHFQDVFGLSHQKSSYFNHKNKRVQTRDEVLIDPVVDTFYKLATHSFKGAHNVAYAIGATENEVATDLDLTGAYSMGLLDLCEPDYDNATHTTNPEDFKGHVLGFAYAEVEFPESVRYPTIAFRAGTNGLYFTHKGKDYVTAAEIDLALRLGARVKILTGCVLPWKNDKRFFEPVIKDLRAKRQQFPKKSTENEMYKLIMNSIYGKTGQGLSGATGFNTTSGESKKIPPSDITNPFFASHITGLIRAVLGELLNNLPQDVKLVNAITDGFLSTIDINDPDNIQPHEVDTSGALCQRFQALVHRVDPGAHMLEVKSKSNQLICGKTRLHFTTEPHPQWSDTKAQVLAKGSISLPKEHLSKPHKFMAETYLNRVAQQKITNTHLISTRQQWLTESDLIAYKREIRLNMEFDFKRKPVNPRMVITPYGDCLTFDTETWVTVDQGLIARGIFDQWRQSNCLTTVEKFHEFDDYYQLQIAKKNIGLRRLGSESCGDLFIKLFIRAYKQQMFGLTKLGTDKSVSEWLEDSGYDSKVSSFSNAKNGKFFEHCLPYTLSVMKAVRLVITKFPALSLKPFFTTDALIKVLEELSTDK
ncbi:MAG: DNA polymerase [Colwellia sp.]